MSRSAPLLDRGPNAEIPLEQALSEIAARAQDLDRSPCFPRANIEALRAAGILELAARGSLAWSVEMVRAVAAGDGSTARILDGHINAAERVMLLAAPALAAERESVLGGRLLLGVWGADPGPGEGQPAEVRRSGGRLVLSGVKTFCSGAGGIQRALVVAAGEQGERRLAYVDPNVGSEIDRSWYRASGLRSSESHRVHFHDTPVLGLLGEADELVRQPWFARDSLRTAATWAGLADAIVSETASFLAGLAGPDDTQLRTLGLIRVASQQIDASLAHAVALIEREPLPGADAASLAFACRATLAKAAQSISALSVQACGSRALLGGGRLDRARRDLDLFVLQHRLDRGLVNLGRDGLVGPLR